MCGIAGKVSLRGPLPPGLIESMCERIVHRGPDSRGIHAADGVALGVQRLRVIDLATGDQPIYNEDRTVAVILNGEIYNFRELRRDLERRGHRFSTRSDTEVIAHLYEERGPELVSDLDGMFAFAVWDERRRRLVLARDRVGKKPLFYSEGEGTIAFASELSALVADEAIPREVDLDALRAYLYFGVVPYPLSIWRAVRKLAPATTLVWEAGRVRRRRFWRLDYSRKRSEPPEELAQELRDRIGGAVRKRLVADVPLGALLSGGIDSAVVVAEMAKASPESIKTFSIGFDVADYDERALARLTAERFGADHEEFLVTPDAIATLPRIVRHYGEPFADSSALPSFYLAEVTRRRVTVALNGDGGDESFAGYPRYIGAAAAAATDRLPRSLRSGIAKAGSRLPPGARHRSLTGYVRRQLVSLPHSPPHRYSRYISLPGLDDLLAPEVKGATSGHPAAFVEAKWEGASGSAAVDVAMETDVERYLPDDLLVKMDVATMASSLEARSPLLDHELMEFAAALPANLKLHRLRRKHLLREAYANTLPAEVLAGRKRGFAVPVGDWLRGPLREYADQLLLDPAARARGYFAEADVKALLDGHRSRRLECGAQIWALLVLELWHREFA